MSPTAVHQHSFTTKFDNDVWQHLLKKKKREKKEDSAKKEASDTGFYGPWDNSADILEGFFKETLTRKTNP